MLLSKVTIQNLAVPTVVLFVMLYRAILTFESVDEILKCDHSNESCWAVLSCGAVYYAVQGGCNFSVCGWNPTVWLLKWKIKATERYFLEVLFIMLHKVVSVLQLGTYRSKKLKLPACTWTLGFNSNITLIQDVYQQGKQNKMNNRLRKQNKKITLTI